MSGVDPTTLFLQNAAKRHVRAASPIDLASQRALQRPRLTPLVMATPPTIAAPSPTYTINPQVSLIWNDPRLTFSGGVMVGRNSNQLGYNGFMLDQIYGNEIGRFEVMIETRHIEIATGGVGAVGQFRVLLNDEYVSLTETAAHQVDVAFHYYGIDLGVRQIVKLTVEFEGTALAWIGIDPTGTAWKTRQREPRVLFVGDSLTAGTSASSQAVAWPQQLCARLGWEDPWVDGGGGTGYLNPGAGHAFGPRVAYSYQYQPDAIVLFGGINDRPASDVSYTPAKLQAAIAALLADIAAHALPGINSKLAPAVYVLGCWQPGGSPGDDVVAANLAIQTAALAAGVTFIDPTGWITGTGHAGATTGVGNGDFAIASDGIHPNDEGHKLIGWRAAEAILATYPRIGA